MSRRSAVHTITAIGVSIASLAVGVVGARALRSDRSATTARPAGLDSETVIDIEQVGSAPLLTTSDADLVPLLAPVAISDDPAIAETLLFSPSDLDGIDDTGSPVFPSGMAGPDDIPVVGAVPISGDSDGSAASPWWYVDFDGSIQTPAPQFIDICAGASRRSPDDAPPAWCPVGTGGTVSDDLVRPRLRVGLVRLASGDRRPAVLPCQISAPGPDSERESLEIVGTAPLARVELRWRPAGTTGSWSGFSVPESALREMQETYRYGIETGELTDGDWIRTCATIVRDLDQAHDIMAFGSDIWGRPFIARTQALADFSPEGRPPTTATIDRTGSRATVTAWTTSEGSVSFEAVLLDEGDELTARSCDESAVDIATVSSTNFSQPRYDMYDPRFESARAVSIELPAGRAAMVCATIYDSENLLRPLATDAILVRGPRRLVPTIALVGVRLNDGAGLDAGTLSVGMRASTELPTSGSASCGGDSSAARGWTNSIAIRAPGSTLDRVLWDCAFAPAPTDADGSTTVQVSLVRRTERDVDTDRQNQHVGIRLTPTDCTFGLCSRRPAEYYEIPIPSPISRDRLTGCVFDCGSVPARGADGVALLEVRWEARGTGMYGSWQLVSTEDLSDNPVGRVPIVQMLRRSPFEPATGLQFSELRSELELVSDRPVTVIGGRLRQVERGEEVPLECVAERPIEPITTGPTTEPRVAITLPCINAGYIVALDVRDAVGTTHEVVLSETFVQGLSGSGVRAEVEFLDDTDGPPAAFVYRFELRIGGYSAREWRAPLRWRNTYGEVSLPPGEVCIEFGATIASVGPINGTLSLGDAGTLVISMMLDSTTVCDERGSGRGSLGVVHLRSAVPVESLRAGAPIVVTSPADSRLQVRITVTAGAWEIEDLGS